MSMYLGTGIYTLAEAARLARAPVAYINRWLYGYEQTKEFKGVSRTYKSSPLWEPEYQPDFLGEKVIGFQDLLELRVVREFVSHGVPLLVIRRCLDTAKDIFKTNHPFTTNRFATDGKTIFADIVRDGQEQEMVDLRGKQLVFREIIKPSLYAGIEYEGKFARRWFPGGGKQKQVVIDPEMQFGKPLLTEEGISTEAIYANFKVEGGDKAAVGLVAKIFEIHPRKVEAAIRFEDDLRRKVA
jgi:uncharacterized protein (DUF433 family)